MVRTARERIKGLGSVASLRKVLMAKIALEMAVVGGLWSCCFFFLGGVLDTCCHVYILTKNRLFVGGFEKTR